MNNKDGEKDQDEVLILGNSAEIDEIITEKSIEDVKILKRTDLIKDIKIKLNSIINKMHRINFPTRFRNLAIYLIQLII